MTYTATPGDGSASPQQIVPGYGLALNRYSKSFSVTLTVSGAVNSIQGNVFGYVSSTTFRALSRLTKFITTGRP